MNLRAVSPLLLAAGLYSCTPSNDKIPEAKFSSIQKVIFHERCNASSCHGSGMKGGLSLIEGASRLQLVGVASTVDKKHSTPWLRVVPGNPDSSFLIVKLTAPDSTEGEVMPRGNDRLSSRQIDSIRQWIRNGAPDN